MKLHKRLHAAVVEKDVEIAYRSALARLRPKAATCSPFGTDGFITWGDVRMLVEVKYDLDFTARAQVCRVLGQCVLYLRKFADAGEPLPNVIFVGDKNECFVLPVTALRGFLDLPGVDWSAAPSTGDGVLSSALERGLNLLPYVYDVTSRFKLAAVLSQVETLAQGKTTTKATLSNMSTIFAHWRKRVFGKSSKLSPVEQVDVFMRCLFDPEDVYLHPKKKNLLVVPGHAAGVKVKSDQYRTFFDHFEQGYSASEVEEFYAAKDRLIDDDARRRQGAFFTPAIWVDEAHKTITEVLGPNWREECIVWDPAAGTGNLTRDYVFADLIITTAERTDVETIRSQGYNPGAVIEQYDFLNPDAPSPFLDGAINRLPAEVDRRLRAAAKAGKRLVFLMNPPYGTANNAAKDGTSRAGMALTEVNKRMKAAKMGACAQQLYTQFMHQSAELVDRFAFSTKTIALFSGRTFMSSGSYAKFRADWYSRFVHRGGFMFQASNFADVSAAWGITFTVWAGGSQHTHVRVVLKSIKGYVVSALQLKMVYSSDGAQASKWARAPVAHVKAHDTLSMSSGLVVKAKGAVKSGTVACLAVKGNCLQEAAIGTWLQSRDPTGHTGKADCAPANFRRCVALFAARKLVAGTWINDKDEYLAPDETAPGYAQWVDDAHVYSLLHPSNNATAMRDVDYADRKWQISNHFFWRTRADALAALDTSATRTLYRDARNNPASYVVPPPEGTPREQWEINGDPYMAHVLPSLDLSPAARDLLDKLDALWLKSLPLREAFAEDRPELHLHVWDGGCYQLKHLWREHFPAEWQALRDAQRVLADQLRPGVYTYGFLLE